MKHNNLRNIAYRPEIDGLRAISVISVILYHADLNILKNHFSGGFLGVDIFFIISGYLITSIILKDINNKSTFSLTKFYQRRIRRILPPLLVMILITMPFAWMFLLPHHFVDFAKSVISALGFGSNIYFYSTSHLYGSGNEFLKPMLHTWSLSIEEQFYLIYPLILIIIFTYLKKYIGIIFILFSIILIIYAEITSKSNFLVNFYSPISRGGELLIGAILAYYENNIKKIRFNKKLKFILPNIGIFIIIFSIIFFKEVHRHPSLLTLIPILGSCLFILFSNKADISSKILSSKIFVYIGLISYSLYLWHYPVISIAKITQFATGDIFKKFIVLIVILAFSIASYHLIEKPARNKKTQFKYIFLLVFSLYIFLITINFQIIKNNGYKERLPKILQNPFDKNFNDLKDNNNNICFDNKDGCFFNTTSETKVFLIGDSHMASLQFDLKNRIIGKNFQFITFTRSGCVLFPGFTRVNLINNVESNCNEKYFEKILSNFDKEKNSIIIIGGRMQLYLNEKLFDNNEGGIEGDKWNKKFISNGKYKDISDSFKHSVINLSKNNKIILVYPIPEVGWNIPFKIRNQFSKNYLYKNENKLKYITTSYDIYKERSKSSFNLLNSIIGNNIYRVYPDKIFCNNLIVDRCITHDDKYIFYSDGDHLSKIGAELVNNKIMALIESIL